MKSLHKLLVENGAKLTVVVYPWPDQIAHADLVSKQVIYWREWCELKDVQFVDLFPCFLEKNSEKQWRRIISERPGRSSSKRTMRSAFPCRPSASRGPKTISNGPKTRSPRF